MHHSYTIIPRFNYSTFNTSSYKIGLDNSGYFFINFIFIIDSEAYKSSPDMLVIYGGISKFCEDYCLDVWTLDLSTFVWTTDFGFSAVNGPGKYLYYLKILLFLDVGVMQRHLSMVLCIYLVVID